MVKIMENPLLKMDDLGVPLFLETVYCILYMIYIYIYTNTWGPRMPVTIRAIKLHFLWILDFPVLPFLGIITPNMYIYTPTAFTFNTQPSPNHVSTSIHRVEKPNHRQPGWFRDIEGPRILKKCIEATNFTFGCAGSMHPPSTPLDYLFKN